MEAFMQKKLDISNKYNYEFQEISDKNAETRGLIENNFNWKWN